MLLYAFQASLYIIEPGFIYFSIKGRSVALFLLSPVELFKVTTNLRLFNLSLPPNNHNYFSIQLLLNLQCTFILSLISTLTPLLLMESCLLNHISVTPEENDHQSTDVLEEMFEHSNVTLWY